jgi:DNA repair exonuclease SbcCD ATPase subunit
MILKNIKAHNFMSYSDLELDLDRGMSLIEGWNFDENSANGSGKSAVLEAITYCIYGQTPRGMKTDEVVNESKNKGCSLELLFDLNGVEYKIVRTRKPNDLILVKTGEEIRGKDIKETQEIIEKLIKVDFKTFITSTYISQDGTFNFIELSDPQKQELLTNILDLSVFDRAYDCTFNLIKEFTNDMARSENNVRGIEYKMDSLIKDIDRLKDEDRAFDQYKAKALSDIDYYIADSIKELSNLALKKSEAERQNIDEMPIFDLDATNIKIKELQEKKKQLQPLRDEISQANGEASRLSAKIEMLEKETKKYSNVSDKCPTCGAPIDITHKQAELSRINKEISEFTKERDMLRSKRAELQNQLTEAEGSFSEIDTLREKIYKYQNQVDQINRQKDKKANDISAIEYRINVQTNSKNSLIKKREIESAKENLYKKMLEEKENDLIALNEECEKGQEEVKEYKIQIDKYEILKKAYKNIKYYIFAVIVDELNLQMKKYLDLLFNSDVKVTINTETITTKGESKQKFSTSLEKDGKERSYASFSGGEKQRVNLATSFALADILLERGSNSINILFLDEVFSRGLDAEGASRMVELLEVVKENKNIFVIDHTEYVKSIIDNIIKIEKRNGISEIVAK